MESLTGELEDEVDLHRRADPPRLQGRRTDPGLSDEGWKQARQTGQFLAQIPLDAVCSSPLIRARQTAEAGMASFEHKLSAETTQADLLALIGTLNADPADDLNATYRWSTDLQTFHDDRLSGFQTLFDDPERTEGGPHLDVAHLDDHGVVAHPGEVVLRGGQLQGGHLAEALEDQLFSLRETQGGDAFPKSALEYLNDWTGSDKGWLRKFYRQDSDEPYFDLTPATEKAIAWLDSLTARSFVGTESRLLTLFDLLRQIDTGSETDPAVRISELERRRDQIDAEIARVRDGDMPLLDDTALKERFQQFIERQRVGHRLRLRFFSVRLVGTGMSADCIGMLPPPDYKM